MCVDACERNAKPRPNGATQFHVGEPPPLVGVLEGATRFAPIVGKSAREICVFFIIFLLGNALKTTKVQVAGRRSEERSGVRQPLCTWEGRGSMFLEDEVQFP